jgi:hyaluronan synthase
MTMGEASKFALAVQLYLAFVPTLIIIAMGCIISAVLPALVYQWRYGGWFGWRWAIPYAFYWLFCLCWISLWGMLTASRSGWLSRGLPNIVPPAKQPIAFPKAERSRSFSKAA